MNLVSDNQADQASIDRPDRQFLRFQLPPNLMALIEIELVTELVNIVVDRVVPMPHLPPAVMGVYNWRGEILWIVDLAMFLGTARLPRRYRSLQPTIILTSTAESEDLQPKTIGFVVDEIAEIEWCELTLRLDPVPDYLSPALSSWARGMWESASGENLLVLDGQAIINCTDFHADI